MHNTVLTTVLPWFDSSTVHNIDFYYKAYRSIPVQEQQVIV